VAQSDRFQTYFIPKASATMITRKSEAEWLGGLMDGKGTVKFGSGSYDGPYSFKSRFESGTGTNPEELIAAAHAGCFSMALSAALTGAGHPPTRIQTTAWVKLEQAGAAFTITEIELETEGQVPGIDEATFQSIAEEAKRTCPVSKALAGPHITLKAKFLGI
jgi:osmotically inducible protein OsmC